MFKLPAILKLPSGQYLYIKEEFDYREAAFQADIDYDKVSTVWKSERTPRRLRKEHAYKNQLVRLSLKDRILEYNQVNGKRASIQLDGLAGITELDIKRLLEHPVIVFLPNLNRKTQAERKELQKLERQALKAGLILKRQRSYKGRHAVLLPGFYAAKSKYALARFEQRWDVYEEQMWDRASSRLLAKEFLSTDYAAIRTALDHADKYKSYIKKAAEYGVDLDKTKPEDCPKIPHLAVTLMPHQAQALAALAGKKQGIMDVDLGGGKTLLMVCDALLALQQGRAKRPCFVMPTNTIAQQKDEIINKLTKGVNVIDITSLTFAQTYGRELGAIKQAITKAPPNTIVICSYEWLRGEPQFVATGEFTRSGNEKYVATYPRSRFLMDECGIDMVTLDESHRLKNGFSATFNSVKVLASAPIKRIGSGTVCPNTPEDIVAQMGFLDSGALGDFERFKAKYAKVMTYGGSVLEWKEGALKGLREDLKSSGMVSMRRTNWLHLLPERKEEVHIVKLPAYLQKLYEQLWNEILQQLTNPKSSQFDADIAKAWEQFQLDASEGDLESSKESMVMLGKLATFDKFLTNPTTTIGGDPDAEDINNRPSTEMLRIYNIIQKMPPEKTISPKVTKAAALVDKHFATPGNGKIIVFVQHKSSASHFAEWLPKLCKSVSSSEVIYYDAAAKKALEQFKDKKSKIKVLCAVDGSLREGHNLQIANRVIRADLHWSPGTQEQSFGRVFRPGATKTVYIDTLITDKTAEVTKYARLLTKYEAMRKVNSDFDDESDLPYISMNKFSIENFNTVKGDGALWPGLKPFVERYEKVQAHDVIESKRLAKSLGTDLLDRSGSKIEGSKQYEPEIKPTFISKKVTPEMIAWKTLFGGKPAQIKPGKHPKRFVKETEIDAEIPIKAYQQIVQIQGIEDIEVSAGSDRNRPTYLIFALRRRREDLAQSLVKLLSEYKELTVGYSRGVDRRFRICITSFLWYKRNPQLFERWWIKLPLMLRQAMTQAKKMQPKEAEMALAEVAGSVLMATERSALFYPYKLPKAGQTYKFVLHEHRMYKKGTTHWDLRMEVPGHKLVSWAVPKKTMPLTNQKVLAVETTLHPYKFLTLEEDNLETRDGHSKLTIYDQGKYKVIKAESNKWVFELLGHKVRGIYALIRMRQQFWILRATTNIRTEEYNFPDPDVLETVAEPLSLEADVIVTTPEALMQGLTQPRRIAHKHGANDLMLAYRKLEIALATGEISDIEQGIALANKLTTELDRRTRAAQEYSKQIEQVAQRDTTKRAEAATHLANLRAKLRGNTLEDAKRFLAANPAPAEKVEHMPMSRGLELTLAALVGALMVGAGSRAYYHYIGRWKSKPAHALRLWMKYTQKKYGWRPGQPIPHAAQKELQIILTKLSREDKQRLWRVLGKIRSGT